MPSDVRPILGSATVSVWRSFCSILARARNGMCSSNCSGITESLLKKSKSRDCRCPSCSAIAVPPYSTNAGGTCRNFGHRHCCGGGKQSNRGQNRFINDAGAEEGWEQYGKRHANSSRICCRTPRVAHFRGSTATRSHPRTAESSGRRPNRRKSSLAPQSDTHPVGHPRGSPTRTPWRLPAGDRLEPRGSI